MWRNGFGKAGYTVFRTEPGRDFCGSGTDKDMNRRKIRELVPLERSRRVIYLDPRGKKGEKHSILAVVLHVAGIASILYCTGIAVFGFGSYFFLIWGGIGVVCLCLGHLLDNRRIMDRIPKGVKTAAGGLACAGLLCFCGVEGLIFTQYHAEAEAGADYCIILGAQLKTTGPSEVLRRRLEKAVEYLQANPDTKVIVSGGQGSNEPVSEAVGMFDYLVKAGIAPERILLEDQSANTFENLVFSGELLDRKNDSVVLVTNNFHMFRALGIAKKQGYDRIQGLAADSVAGMAPNNLLREFLGVLKDFVLGNL